MRGVSSTRTPRRSCSTTSAGDSATCVSSTPAAREASSTAPVKPGSCPPTVLWRSMAASILRNCSRSAPSATRRSTPATPSTLAVGIRTDRQDPPGHDGAGQFGHRDVGTLEMHVGIDQRRRHKPSTGLDDLGVRAGQLLATVTHCGDAPGRHHNVRRNDLAGEDVHHTRPGEHDVGRLVPQRHPDQTGPNLGGHVQSGRTHTPRAAAPIRREYQPCRALSPSRSAPDCSAVSCRPQGSVPERTKGAGCKPAGDAFGGSNPPRPTNFQPPALRGGAP